MWFRTLTKTFDRPANTAQQAGFSLVELMVALALGMLITVAVASVYVGQRIGTSLGKQMSLLQEEGSRALDALARDLRQAGDFNCATSSGIALADTGITLTNTSAIRGFASFNEINTLPGATAIATALQSNVANSATQIIAISGALDSHSPLRTSAVATATSLNVNHQDFAAGQTVVVSDCINASVLRIQRYVQNEAPNTASGSLTLTTQLKESYAESTSVARIATVWWFFGTPTISGAAWPRGLYRVDGDLANASTGTGFRLISTRIRDLNFAFDRDTSTPADGVIDTRSVTSANVGSSNWGSVRRARAEILLRSDSQVFAEAQPYYFNGSEHTPTDKYAYLPLELSTTLRNTF